MAAQSGNSMAGYFCNITGQAPDRGVQDNLHRLLVELGVEDETSESSLDHCSKCIVLDDIKAVKKSDCVRTWFYTDTKFLPIFDAGLFHEAHGPPLYSFIRPFSPDARLV